MAEPGGFLGGLLQGLHSIGCGFFGLFLGDAARKPGTFPPGFPAIFGGTLVGCLLGAGVSAVTEVGTLAGLLRGGALGLGVSFLLVLVGIFLSFGRR